MQHKNRNSGLSEFLDSLGFLLLQRFIFCPVLDIRVSQIMETQVLDASVVQNLFMQLDY